MATSISQEAQASTTNELYIHTNEVFRSSNIISGIQTANDRTPVADDYHSHYYQHRQNMPPQATIPTQAPATPGTAKPSTASGSQHAPTPNRAPGGIVDPVQLVSRNYQGNRFAQRNQSANIPPEHSTSVWITNLPPNCNYAELLGMVRDAGKVYATVINPPQGNFMTSAAKIVFFDVEGRRRFEARANTGQFAVGAYVPRVRPNRILTAAQPLELGSRVLHITGPASVVNQSVLCDYFRRWCAFDLEYIQHLPLEDGNVTMVWAFGSYRCQAERVFAAIGEIKELNITPAGSDVWDSVVVCYGRDPCDR
ncbi:hypothetical protein F5B21DRAFT_502952 [Xylaria acuta]|nr:hypothetical protein F5B21DRAFT_502952 [Xylaria acuta]